MQEEYKGGFLFISHSHKDMDKVRQLRNKLEDAGYEPLCFYLKALDNSEEELDDLIKREIDSRQWFVYAESENSRESEWVQKERRWRKREGSRNNQELKVDLESDMSIDEISRTLIKGLRVNLIYSRKDIEFVKKLACKLMQRDLQVTGHFDGIGNDENILKQTMENIKTAGEFGTNIVVVSRSSVNSEWLLREVQYAFSEESSTIPVLIDDVELEGRLKFLLMNTQYIVPQKPIRDEKALDGFVDRVVDEISDVLDYKFKSK